MYKINIAKDFSEYPGLRHCTISDDSGEEFYHKILNEKFHDAFTKKETLIINLDKTTGFAPSFLDESFGNLVFDFELSNVKKYVEVITTQEPYWEKMIFEDTIILWEERRIKGVKPKVTKLHKPWYRLIDNELKREIWEQPTTV